MIKQRKMKVMAESMADVRAHLAECDVVFQYGRPRDALSANWALTERLRWVHVGGVGVDWALFPELIESDVAGYARRHELPPGLTGLAQVNGRYDTDADYKLGYDLQYLVNWSLVLDLQILLRTVWVVLSRRV